MVRKQNKKMRRISPNLTAVIGALVIMIGGFFLSYNYIQTMKIATYDRMANSLYIENERVASIEVARNEEETRSEDSNTNTEDTPNVTNQVIEKYIGYLSIPKINLKNGFFAQESSENNVEKNIYIVNGSSYPDVENGNFIIAGHSGTGWKAFFNDLYKLEIGDSTTVNYNNKNYKYNITKIYKQQKTGKIAIYRNYDKTTLTLVTCTNNDSQTQTIYIAELTSVE